MAFWDGFSWIHPSRCHLSRLGQRPGYHPLPSKDHYWPGRWLLEGYRSNPVLTLSLLSSPSELMYLSIGAGKRNPLTTSRKNHVTNDS